MSECGTIWEGLLAVQIVLTGATADPLVPATEIENNIPDWSSSACSAFLYPVKNSMPSSYYGAEM